jgi:hypothetical protein
MMYSRTKDYMQPYIGFWNCQCQCRVELWEAAGKPPIIILTEDPENRGTSITNMIEILTAEVIRSLDPAIFEAAAEPPFYLVERYGPRLADARESLALVTFRYRAPRTEYLAPIQHAPGVTIFHGRAGRRMTLGEPDWRHIQREELEALLGRPYPEPAAWTHEERLAAWRAARARNSGGRSTGTRRSTGSEAAP